MMNQASESMYLAWKDWKFEYLLSLCAVLALASMLTPLLVLQGLKNGIIEGMRTRLMEDPTVLIITPKSDAGKFSQEFIDELNNLPGTRFAIGRTRDTSTDVTLQNSASQARVSVAFEPSSPGEPVLERFAIPTPNNGPEPEIILSQPAAKALGAEQGTVLSARLARRNPEGKLESTAINLHVAHVLPIEAADRRMAFAPLPFMEDMENYRDYIEVPERNLTGNKHPGKRDYSSFRLYAKNMDVVEDLAEDLGGKGVEVITKAREIASIRMLERAINQVILIISLAVGAGFVAFTLSSVQSAVSRKKRMLGMMRLLGFKRLSLLLYPFTQSLLTAGAGFLLSLAVYLCVAVAIGASFSSQGISCHLSFLNIAVTALIVLVLSIAACIRAALEAAEVEPSIVIREV